MNKFVSALIGFSFASVASVALAQDEAAPDAAEASELDNATNLQEILDLVRDGTIGESRDHKEREVEFANARNRQQQLLNDAEAERVRQERRSEQLEATRRENEAQIITLTQQLNDRKGELSEIFGTIQQFAGDMRGIVQGSHISLQNDGRGEQLDNLISKASEGSQLPSIEEIESLWEQMVLEIEGSSEVVKFTTDVQMASGEKVSTDVIRVGDFNLISDGKYFTYQAQNNIIEELGRQPSGRFTGTAADLTGASGNGLVLFGVDTSRGQILRTLLQAATLEEKFHQGKEVGYLIAGLGLIGLLLVLERVLYLIGVGSKVRSQIRSDTAKDNNPLGRVLMVYDDNRSVDVETLELKLDEAILKETPKLERFLNMIKLISAVAPLFGLLGTVTGMIATFQSITLFGTGDPKLMANGISQALVTTVLGLVVAIPMLLLHSMVSGMSKRIVHTLEEQSAGIIAVHAEKGHG